MSGKPFTLEQVLEATREIVDEKGHDFVYPQVEEECVYADGQGQPSCLVGHVIKRLSPVAFERLASRERHYGGETAGRLVRKGYLPDGFWTDDAEKAMLHAQDYQDSGKSWSEALYAAENLGADAD